MSRHIQAGFIIRVVIYNFNTLKMAQLSNIVNFDIPIGIWTEI